MNEFTNKDAIECINEHIQSLEKLKQKFIVKPEKVILLSGIIGQDIDVEFSDRDGYWLVGNLVDIVVSGEYGYESNIPDCDFYRRCRMRENHWYCWNGGVRILPEGFEVVLRFRNGTTCKTTDYKKRNWVHLNKDNDIISFYIVRKIDGWGYKWEMGNDMAD